MDRGNVIAVARREYVARGSTRTFKWSTILLVLAGLGVTLAPVILRAVFGEGQQTRIEVFVGDSHPSVDVAAQVRGVLNAPLLPGGTGSGNGSGGNGDSRPQYLVEAITDETASRARVLAGDVAGLLVVDRPTADGDLTFAYVTKQTTLDRIAPTVRQVASSVAIQDRLAGSGIPPAEQAKLFAEPKWSVEPADPNAPPSVNPDDLTSGFAIGFVLAIALFMAIILYGQWVAYSVVEEKSSRVMEVILGAATPFELLAGKVVGVGALALTQYIVVFVPAVIALLFQGQIAALIFGGSGDGAAGLAGTLTSGLSIPLLVAFGVFFVLGFALYAALYAGAAALVSRTEDINQIVAPMTIVATAGYLVAVYSSTGLLDPNSTFVMAMAYIPFFSPYLMLSRFGLGVAGPVEVLVAIALLLVTIPIAIWLAARFYAAGVLMYGQRPSLRLMLRVLRGTR
ncbi:MAG TPA: ABC transporter permease [Candidatus Limnocylindrales bacterium]